MNLTTRYLGLTLPHPFMPGSSPLAADLDLTLRLEDAGASAIVLPSLFAEQITPARGSAAALFPSPSDYAFNTDRYLETVKRTKNRIGVPLIASLNGTNADSWLTRAKLIEQAGADALEANVYYLATDLAESAASVEHRVTDIVAVIVESIGIPLAVKLSPFYSSLPNLAWRLTNLGAAGLVLFNRFLQRDFDPADPGAVSSMPLSDSSELQLRLHWLRVLSGRLPASLAVSGGVHTAVDAVKAVMAGAHGIQMVSSLIRHGPAHLTRIRTEFDAWGDAHGYGDIGDMRGSMRIGEDPASVTRSDYLHVLQTGRRAHLPDTR
jgi:dihydroorotate dehydrogenase (fumarate)